MSIHVLSADVFNKIAAGEVVDRPYSVVKELVENALDAGATEIGVETEGGGKRLIRVTDNGCGIPKDELRLAYLPHATSKLSRAEDLERIRTLGFRGEAIASIAAVSRMKLTSKTKDGEAYSLRSEGGALGELTRDGGADGTCALVEDLFFNTPARRKFLKSDAQEDADIANMLSRFLLSRPEVSFTYTANGKVKYRSFGDGLRSALAVVYGADVLNKTYEFDAEKNGIRLHGFLGAPEFSKPNRSYQSLFVNGRYVVNQTVSAAVSNAYGAYLMKRQYPFFVLFLEVPPEVVDVNVHPNKADVRFAENQVIYGCVYSVVSAILDGNARALEYLVPAEGKKGEAAPAAAAAPAAPAPAQMSYEQAKKQLSFDVPPLGGRTPVPRPFREERNELEVHAPAAPAPREDVFEENRRFLLERENKARQDKIDADLLVYKGEIFRTYLCYELGDTVYLIDQHAAHERLIYDRLRAKCEARTVCSQPMLVPYLLNVNAQEFAFLEKNLQLLRELGFEAEPFGGNSLKISAVPADLRDIRLEEFFGEVLASMETLRGIRLPDLLKDKLATAACKAAVKGGEALTDGEVRSLIRAMQGDMTLKCPHGRPVAVRIARAEIEKLFKRIV